MAFDTPPTTGTSSTSISRISSSQLTSTTLSTVVRTTENTTATSTTTTATRPSATAPVDFRPVFHFVPEQNWINEPNGLIKIGSTWHLFFQHNPTGNFWGNLSWGHATSTDLVSWTHKPVAISSADGIQAFTGTAYFDSQNLSGLGSASNPPYLAFYTGYFPSTGCRTSGWRTALTRASHGPSTKAIPSSRKPRKSLMIPPGVWRSGIRKSSTTPPRADR